MNDRDKLLPANTMGIIVACSEDGGMSIMVGHNFTDEFDKDAAFDYEMILDGLNYMLKYQTEFMHQIGEMAMLAGKGLDEAEQEMIEEYDRKQAEAANEPKAPANVLHFPKGRLN
jgi:hypothetical protein